MSLGEVGGATAQPTARVIAEKRKKGATRWVKRVMASETATPVPALRVSVA